MSSVPYKYARDVLAPEVLQKALESDFPFSAWIDGTDKAARAFDGPGTAAYKAALRGFGAYLRAHGGARALLKENKTRTN